MSLLGRGQGRASRLIAELAQETSLPGEWVGGSLLDCQVRDLVRVEAWSRPLAEALTLLHGHGNDTLAAIGTAFPVPTSLTATHQVDTGTTSPLLSISLCLPLSLRVWPGWDGTTTRSTAGPSSFAAQIHLAKLGLAEK